MTERVLTTRELNRAMLARQLLLERSSMPLTRAVEQVAGLQTQHAPSAYVALWARLRDFDRDALTRALHQRRVVQGTMMRITIHMATARDYWLFTEGIRRERRKSGLGQFRRLLQGIDVEAAAELVRTTLADGPRRNAEMLRVVKEAGYPTPWAWYASALFVDLLRYPPSGTWERKRADLYGLAEEWIPKPDVTEEQGLEHLVRRYLGGFGPAAVGDIAGWAGLTVGTLRPVVERLRLRRFRDEEGGELVDLPRAPLPPADTPAPPRFLHTWEPVLLVSSRRAQILPDEYRGRIVIPRQPQWISTFTVDGAVAGTWRFRDGKVEVEPFAPLPRVAKREVEEEAAALAAFQAD